MQKTVDLNPNLFQCVELLRLPFDMSVTEIHCTFKKKSQQKRGVFVMGFFIQILLYIVIVIILGYSPATKQLQ